MYQIGCFLQLRRGGARIAIPTNKVRCGSPFRTSELGGVIVRSPFFTLKYCSALNMEALQYESSPSHGKNTVDYVREGV